MYFVGTAQTHTPDADGPSEGTTFLTRQEKMLLADDLTEGRSGDIHIVVDHADGEKMMANAKHWSESPGAFVTPTQKRIGKMHEAFVDDKGDLVVTGELFYHRPETKAIIDGINGKGDKYEKWGLSLCTDLGRSYGRVESKQVSHLGITRDPEFGEEGTWLHHAFLSPASLNEYLEACVTRPNYYFPEKMRARYNQPAGRGNTISVGATKEPSKSPFLIHEPPCAPPATAPLFPLGAATSMSNPAPTATPAAPTEHAAAAAPQSTAQKLQEEFTSKFLGAFTPPDTESTLRQKEEHLERLAQQRAQELAAKQAKEKEDISFRQKQLENFGLRAQAVTKDVDLKDPLKMANTKLFEELLGLKDEYMKLANDLKAFDVPRPASRAYEKVEETLEQMLTNLRDDPLITNESAETGAMWKNALTDPLTYKKAVVGVMANHANSLQNQRRHQAELQKERDEIAKLHAAAAAEKQKYEKELADLRSAKRDRDPYEDHLSYKRQRTETAVVSPAPPLNAAINPAANGEKMFVSVGASKERKEVNLGMIDRGWEWALPPKTGQWASILKNVDLATSGRGNDELRKLMDAMEQQKSSLNVFSYVPWDGPMPDRM